MFGGFQKLTIYAAGGCPFDALFLEEIQYDDKFSGGTASQTHVSPAFLPSDGQAGSDASGLLPLNALVSTNGVVPGWSRTRKLSRKNLVLNRAGN